MKLKTFVPALVLLALLAGCAQPRSQPPAQGYQPPPLEEITDPSETDAQAGELGEAAGDNPLDTPTGPEITPGVPLDDSIRVGLLLPLSGRHAGIGQALLNAAQIALFDVGNESFKLIVRDTQGTATGARRAANEAIGQGAGLILGPLFSSSMEAVGEVAAFRRVPVVGFSNNAAVARPGVYIMGVAPELQVARIVDFAVRQGLPRYALLAPESTYGNVITAAFQDAVLRSGAAIASVTFYDPLSEDVSLEVQRLADYGRREQDLKRERVRLKKAGDQASLSALRRLENKDTLGPPDFDAILLPQGGREILSVAPLLNYYDVDPVDVRFLGTALWEDESLIVEPSLQGGWFVAPDPALWQAFRERYRSFYQEDPPRLSTLAYDATALTAVLARQASGTSLDRPFTIEKITNPSGFAGVDGAFRFLPDGRIERALAVLEMGPEGFVVLDPAPTSFQGGGF